MGTAGFISSTVVQGFAMGFRVFGFGMRAWSLMGVGRTLGFLPSGLHVPSLLEDHGTCSYLNPKPKSQLKPKNP